MEDRYEEQVLSRDVQVARYAHGINLRTYEINSAVAVCPLEPGNFRGKVGTSWPPHILDMFQQNKFDDNGRLTDWTILDIAQTDGLGGKPQFRSLIGTQEAFYGAGADIIAMAADDLGGALLTTINTDINIQRVTDQNLPLAFALFDGLFDALKLVSAVCDTGETAVMRRQITSFCDKQSDDQLVFTWGASCHGLMHRSHNWIEREITAGMPIVGLLENGHRCNGNGWFVDLILAYFGDVESILTDVEAMEFVKKLTEPSVIYCKLFSELLGWTAQATLGEPIADVRAIANISGNGLLKLIESLKGFGAHLDSMPTPPPVMLQAQDMSWTSKVPEDLILTDEKGHTTLNAGVGGTVVTANEAEAVKVIEAATRHNIAAQIIGHTTDSGELSIVSRYNLRPGQTIYPLRKTA